MTRGAVAVRAGRRGKCGGSEPRQRLCLVASFHVLNYVNTSSNEYGTYTVPGTRRSHSNVQRSHIYIIVNTALVSRPREYTSRLTFSDLYRVSFKTTGSVRLRAPGEAERSREAPTRMQIRTAGGVQRSDAGRGRQPWHHGYVRFEAIISATCSLKISRRPLPEADPSLRRHSRALQVRSARAPLSAMRSYAGRRRRVRIARSGPRRRGR